MLLLLEQEASEGLGAESFACTNQEVVVEFTLVGDWVSMDIFFKPELLSLFSLRVKSQRGGTAPSSPPGFTAAVVLVLC